MPCFVFATQAGVACEASKAEMRSPSLAQQGLLRSEAIKQKQGKQLHACRRRQANKV
jgi:hypothetical protein